jgi:Fe2+ transport system protein B
MAARRGEGVPRLLRAISEVAQKTISTEPRHIKFLDESLEKAIETLAQQLRENFDNLPNARWVALRLLEGDESIIEAVRNKKLGDNSVKSQISFSRPAEAK